MATSNFKYAGLADELKRQMAADRLGPGDRLPTEDELMKRHGLSRITVRRALSLLEKDGLVSRKRKLGTFVNRALEPMVDLHLLRGAVVIAISHQLAGIGEEDHALATLLRGVEQFLSEHGFEVRIMSLGRHEQRDHARLVRLMEQGDVAGICAVGPCIDRYRDLLQSVPVINTATFVPNAVPWVGMNMEDATRTCIEYLLQRGHRRIAMICGPWIDAAALAEFARGYQGAFEQRGVPFDRTLLHHAYAGEALDQLAEQVLKMPQHPTAIFAEDWRITRAVLRAAQSLGRDIPQDLSLLGCGQNILFVASTVGITAYVPDTARVGLEIGRQLLNIINGGAAPTQPIFVPGRLVEQESVCPPRS